MIGLLLTARSLRAFAGTSVLASAEPAVMWDSRFDAVTGGMARITSMLAME